MGTHAGSRGSVDEKGDRDRERRARSNRRAGPGQGNFQKHDRRTRRSRLPGTARRQQGNDHQGNQHLRRHAGGRRERGENFPGLGCGRRLPRGRLQGDQGVRENPAKIERRGSEALQGNLARLSPRRARSAAGEAQGGRATPQRPFQTGNDLRYEHCRSAGAGRLHQSGTGRRAGELSHFTWRQDRRRQLHSESQRHLAIHRGDGEREERRIAQAALRHPRLDGERQKRRGVEPNARAPEQDRPPAWLQIVG